ncbi:phosphopantetheine-binding protein [Bacillus pacificus]
MAGGAWYRTCQHKRKLFDYGGDSIKAIQISSQLRKYRLKLETKYLFTHATIQEVAIYIEPLKKQIDQRQISGEILLSPIQNWFFQKILLIHTTIIRLRHSTKQKDLTLKRLNWRWTNS